MPRLGLIPLSCPLPRRTSRAARPKKTALETKARGSFYFVATVPDRVRFFVTAAKGTEPALRDELRELRFRAVRADRGGVHFEGEWLEGFRACLTTRIGLRVLTAVAQFPCADEDALY